MEKGLSDIELIIVGLVSNNLSLAKEALNDNQIKFAQIYINVCEGWIKDLKTLKENNMI